MKRTVVGILSAFCVTAAGLSILPAAAEASAAAEDASTELESAAASSAEEDDFKIHFWNSEIRVGTDADLMSEFENTGDTDLDLSQYDCTVQEITNTGSQFSCNLPSEVSAGAFHVFWSHYQIPADCTAPQVIFQIQLTPKSGEGDVLATTITLTMYTVQDGVLHYFDESRSDKYRLIDGSGEGIESSLAISVKEYSTVPNPDTGVNDLYLTPGYPTLAAFSTEEGQQVTSVTLDPPDAGTVRAVSEEPSWVTWLPEQTFYFEIDLHAPATVRAEALSVEEARETDQGIQMEPATPEDAEALKNLRLVTESASEADTQKVQEAMNSSDPVQVYEIRTENAVGEAENPSGKVKVTLPIPSGWDAFQTMVYRLESDGSLTDMKGTPNEDGSAISFVTEHFSLYALAQGKAQEPAEPGTTAPETTVPEATAPEGGGQDTDPTLTPTTEIPETTGTPESTQTPESNGETDGAQTPESTNAPESSSGSQKDSSVRTGDDSQLFRWIVLLVVAVGGLAAAVWMVWRHNSR